MNFINPWSNPIQCKLTGLITSELSFYSRIFFFSFLFIYFFFFKFLSLFFFFVEWKQIFIKYLNGKKFLSLCHSPPMMESHPLSVAIVIDHKSWNWEAPHQLILPSCTWWRTNDRPLLRTTWHVDPRVEGRISFSTTDITYYTK